jgi:hypothetical protein
VWLIRNYVLNLRVFKLLQPCDWDFRSSGIWHRVIKDLVADFSRLRNGLISTCRNAKELDILALTDETTTLFQNVYSPLHIEVVWYIRRMDTINLEFTQYQLCTKYVSAASRIFDSTLISIFICLYKHFRNISVLGPSSWTSYFNHNQWKNTEGFNTSINKIIITPILEYPIVWKFNKI